MTRETELIEAFQSGDDFAFVSLYNRYKEGVYSFALRMLRDRDAAKDAMQETFLRIYENRDRLLKTHAFRAWLFSIARNQCLNMLRHSNRQVPLSEAADQQLQETATRPLEKAEQIALVQHFLGRLKPEYREVIILREYHHMSYAEIAAVTKSTLSAVKSRLYKARRKLAAGMLPVLERESQRLAAVMP